MGILNPPWCRRGSERFGDPRSEHHPPVVAVDLAEYEVGLDLDYGRIGGADAFADGGLDPIASAAILADGEFDYGLAPCPIRRGPPVSLGGSARRNSRAGGRPQA